MANHKQAIKRHRQSLARTQRNLYYKSTLKTRLKRARVAIADAAPDAQEQVIKAVSWLDHCAVRKVIPKQRAARLKSRLESQLAKA